MNYSFSTCEWLASDPLRLFGYDVWARIISTHLTCVCLDSDASITFSMAPTHPEVRKALPRSFIEIISTSWISVQRVRPSEDSGNEVNYLCLCNNTIEALDKGQMSRVFVQIILSILLVLKLADEHM